MPTDWWRVTANGVEIARGTWEEISAKAGDFVTDRIQRTRQPQPLGFSISISRAQTVHVPDRTPVAGESRERRAGSF
jgi:hypothetical protein